MSLEVQHVTCLKKFELATLSSRLSVRFRKAGSKDCSFNLKTAALLWLWIKLCSLLLMRHLAKLDAVGMRSLESA